MAENPDTPVPPRHAADPPHAAHPPHADEPPHADVGAFVPAPRAQLRQPPTVPAVPADVGVVVPASRAQMRQPRPRGDGWRRVAELAAQQHGTVAFAQLVAIGLSPSAIERAVADGLLAVLHRGVFAFGHARLTRDGRWMAAVLAGGDDAALTHTDSLVLRAIVRSSAPRIHVTVPRLTGGAHRRGGLVLHRCKLDPQDRDIVDGIPTTTVARALLDFAEIASYRRLERALDEAYKLQLFDLDATLDVLTRGRGRRGVKALKRAIELYVPEPQPTRSWLEDRALKLIREAGLPMPQVNLHLNGYEVDLQWPQADLVVELDSREHHDTPWAREGDAIRDAHQVARGHGVMRFTHRRITREPDEVVALIRERLNRAAQPSSTTVADRLTARRGPF